MGYAGHPAPPDLYQTARQIDRIEAVRRYAVVFCKLLRQASFPLLMMLTAWQAPAEVIAYEGFACKPAGSSLLGSNGGRGFATPWQAGGFNAASYGDYRVEQGSLAFGRLATSGGSVSGEMVPSAIGGLFRRLAQPIGEDGTTVYLSFLLRPNGTLNAGHANGYFGLCLHSTIAHDMFIGKPGNGSFDEYVLEDRGTFRQVPSAVKAAVGQTVLLVVRADFFAGPDRFTLFVNPTPGEPEPAGAVKYDLDAGPIDGIVIYSTGAFSIDEIRLGTTFADVTPRN